jgi:cytochrome c biogenesis protein
VIVNADAGSASQFCSSSPTSYDNFRPGLLVDGTGLAPFCVSIDKFAATYTSTGQASSFVASIRYQSGAQLKTDAWTSRALEVNDPLRLQGQRLYLLGHGYSPVFTVTYPDGSTQTQTQPFQPKDAAFTSEGAVKFLDPPGYTGAAVLKHQLAVVGIFAPSAVLDSQQIMTSNFPAPQTPGVAIQVYRGDMGMESGQAQSIFSIDADQVASGKLVKLNRANLAPGESMKLDDGTTVTFTGYKQWVSLQTSYDPAQGWALVFAISLLVGLMGSLIIKRRRVWFRVSGPLPATDAATGDSTDSGRTGGVVDPVPPGTALSVPRRTVASDDRITVDIGGLARTDQAGYGEEFTKLVALAGAGNVPVGQRR